MPTAVKRKPLPKGNHAAARAVRLHLSGHGFGEGRGGLVVSARDGGAEVGVLRKHFADPDEMSRLVAALTGLTAVRLLKMTMRTGPLFDTYVYTPEDPPVENADTRVENVDTRVTLSLSRYQSLCDAARTLDRLKAAGVDNWEGYDDALRED